MHRTCVSDCVILVLPKKSCEEQFLDTSILFSVINYTEMIRTECFKKYGIIIKLHVYRDEMFQLVYSAITYMTRANASGGVCIVRDMQVSSLDALQSSLLKGFVKPLAWVLRKAPYWGVSWGPLLECLTKPLPSMLCKAPLPRGFAKSLLLVLCKAQGGFTSPFT